jgi:hypothetical protein
MLEEQIRRAKFAELEANAGPCERAYLILARLGIVGWEAVEHARKADLEDLKPKPRPAEPAMPVVPQEAAEQAEFCHAVTEVPEPAPKPEPEKPFRIVEHFPRWYDPESGVFNTQF